MKLSIIIPIYKVEKYLQKCLDSCLHQDMLSTDYEIICVNDGSPDNCGLILEEYAAKYSNLSVITQKNQGLSIARNNGLDVAKGDYVWFVDSDDWIEENCLRSIGLSLDKCPDILQLSYNKVNENDAKQSRVFCKYDNNTTMSGQEVILLGGLPSAAQFSIYRREFLISHNLKFAEGRLHEDIEFKPRATFLACKITWHTPIVYNYLLRSSGSIMSSFKLKNGVDIIYAINSISNFMTDLRVEGPCEGKFLDIIGKYFNTLMKVYYSLPAHERKQLKTEILNNDKIFELLQKSSNNKYRIQGYMFGFNFDLGCLFLRVYKLFT